MFIIEERSLVAVLSAFTVALVIGFGFNALLSEPDGADQPLPLDLTATQSTERKHTSCSASRKS